MPGQIRGHLQYPARAWRLRLPLPALPSGVAGTQLEIPVDFVR